MHVKSSMTQSVNKATLCHISQMFPTFGEVFHCFILNYKLFGCIAVIALTVILCCDLIGRLVNGCAA